MSDFLVTKTKVTSARFEIQDAYTLAVALRNGAYETAKVTLQKTPDEITNEIYKSDLKGRGGGGSHCGKKWLLMPQPYTQEVYLAVNADESEPGTCKDRYILAKDPHLLIEGIIISAFALGVHKAYIYIRGEYFLETSRLQRAIDEAYDKGILGKRVLDTDYRLHVTLHRGAGAYICGERTAMLESIEGNRGQPRLKPHVPEPDHLFGKPCVVNNVETISTVPYIIKYGAQHFKTLGTHDSAGTMLFQVSGHINRPCVVEEEFGKPLMKFINEYGQGVKGGRLKAVIPGGSSCQLLTADEAQDAVMSYEGMWEKKTALGTGGMIVLNEHTDMVKACINLMDFYKEESCGKCTPCREGTGWGLKLFEKIYHGQGSKKDFDTLMDISDYLNGKTICVFAPAVNQMMLGFLNKFADDFYKLIKA